ncbi:MAG: thioesterase family protein [Desulfobacterales bacterium]|jgi:acyl-CoA thioester hydrolase|nr:thioesterase family protein [Desulfobacterales bacterium]
MKWIETYETVRFNEVDSWGIAWHGHYVAWFEAGRMALLRQVDLLPEHMTALGFIAPVIRLNCEYKYPAKCGEDIIIRAAVEKPEIAAIEFKFEVLRRTDRKLLARGASTQVLLTLENTMIYKVSGELKKRLDSLVAFCARDA